MKLRVGDYFSSLGSPHDSELGHLKQDHTVFASSTVLNDPGRKDHLLIQGGGSFTSHFNKTPRSQYSAASFFVGGTSPERQAIQLKTVNNTAMPSGPFLQRNIFSLDGKSLFSQFKELSSQ